MDADVPHHTDNRTEKQVTKSGDKPLAGAAITSTDDNAKGGPTSLAEIGKHGPWAAQMLESEWTKFPKPPHVVIVDGPSPSGNVMIRDPLEGTRYEMTVKDFLKAWNRSCAYRRVE